MEYHVGWSEDRYERSEDECGPEVIGLLDQSSAPQLSIFLSVIAFPTLSKNTSEQIIIENLKAKGGVLHKVILEEQLLPPPQPRKQNPKVLCSLDLDTE